MLNKNNVVDLAQNKKQLMNEVFLSLGSNLGDRISNLKSAASLLSELVGNIIAVGALYETEPWGFESSSWFVNTVIKLETKLNPNEVIQKCISIENQLGRKNNEAEGGYSSRPIDIDILFFNNEIINTSNLIIPHENLHKRKFVLTPLNDIAAKFIHPTINQTVNTLLKNCLDNMSLKKLNIEFEI